MASWTDDREKDLFGGGGNIERLTMKEGKYTIRILGQPRLFRFHWVNKVNRSVITDPNLPPSSELAAIDRGQLKYVCNVIDRADGLVKLWEFSRRVKTSIVSIAEDYGSPEGYDLIVTRKGMKAEDTTYTIIPTRESVPLTEEERTLPQYDLEKLYAPTPEEKVTSFLEGVIPQKVEGKSFSTESSSATSVVADDLPTL